MRVRRARERLLHRNPAIPREHRDLADGAMRIHSRRTIVAPGAEGREVDHVERPFGMYNR